MLLWFLCIQPLLWAGVVQSPSECFSSALSDVLSLSPRPVGCLRVDTRYVGTHIPGRGLLEVGMLVKDY